MRRDKIITEVLDYEMVHWADDELFIAHKGNKILYRKKAQEQIIEMPMDSLGWKKYLMSMRKIRRLLRTDKAMIIPTKSGLLLVRFGKVYIYELNSKKWTCTLSDLNCRNPMYNGLLVVEDRIYIAEYGNPNGVGKRIFQSRDGGWTWSAMYQFAPDEIRHIHCLAWDTYEKRIWIFTGDEDRECFVLKTDLDFEEVKIVGGGSQKWRACHAIFMRDTVNWFMDSPVDEVKYIKYNRLTGEIEADGSFAGPIWFAREYDSYALAASSQEIGPSHKDNKLHLYKSVDLFKWDEVGTFRHDLWPKRYFRFGTMTMARGTKPFISCEGVKGYDGKTIMVDIM